MWGSGVDLLAHTDSHFSPCSDLPCYMSTVEMKSLLRLPDILAFAPQNISVVEVSALQGTGLASVLLWLQEHHGSHT